MKKLTLITVMLFVASIAFTAGYKTIKVGSGETIQKIANKHLKNPSSWKSLLRYNKLTGPRDIKPGMTLKVPYSLSKERVAKITFKVGDVKVNGKNTKLGALVKKGDRIVTGTNGRATVKLDDGSNIKVEKNSEISLSQYGFQKHGRNSNVQLKKGGMLVKVNKLTRKSKFGVSSVTAVAGVRGTTFYVKMNDKNKNANISVFAGQVDVKKKNSTKVTSVKKGHAINVDDKKKDAVTVSIPKKLQWIK
jgi:hypothetical protein